MRLFVEIDAERTASPRAVVRRSDAPRRSRGTSRTRSGFKGSRAAETRLGSCGQPETLDSSQRDATDLTGAIRAESFIGAVRAASVAFVGFFDTENLLVLHGVQVLRRLGKLRVVHVTDLVPVSLHELVPEPPFRRLVDDHRLHLLLVLDRLVDQVQ